MPINPPTYTELYNAYKAEVLTIDPTLTDWVHGSGLDALAGASSVGNDETALYALRLMLTHFLSTATGQDLDDLVLERFNMVRQGPTNAVGAIIWKRGLGHPVYPIPTGTVVSGTLESGDAFSVETTQEATSEYDVVIAVKAVAAGAAGNVHAYAVDTPDPFLDGDTNAIVFQQSRLAGGSDDETDAQLRNRARRFYLTLARGTEAALIQAATSVAGISYASVVQTFGSGPSLVQVFIADLEGAANPTLVGLAEIPVDAAKAAGIYVVVAEAVRQDEVFQVTVSIPLGDDPTVAQATAESAVLDYVNSSANNEPVYASQMAQEVHNALPRALSVSSTRSGGAWVQASPATPQNTIRLTSGNLTVTVVEV